MRKKPPSALHTRLTKRAGVTEYIKMRQHDSQLAHHNTSSLLNISGIPQEMAQVGEDAGGDRSLKIRLCSYQQEMLKKSLEGNIIVAMPTGSKCSQLGC